MLDQTPESEKIYMEGYTDDLTFENISKWISEQNLKDKKARIVDGFEIIASVDGNKDAERKREVSLVKAFPNAYYPPHIHEKSDGLFYVTKGRGTLIPDNVSVKEGDIIEIPKGKIHGFKILEQEPLEFLSVQVPPIKDQKTGEEDFNYPEGTKATEEF